MPLRGKWVWFFFGGSSIFAGGLIFSVSPHPLLGFPLGAQHHFAYWANASWMVLCGCVCLMIGRRTSRRD